MWRNTTSAYGLVSIVLHWLIAAAILGLFGLGLWMVDLSYYHPWYTTAPDIHRSIGVLVGAAVLARLIWRGLNPRPAFETGMARWERAGALAAHWVMYALMLGVVAAGYLITTAQGDAVSVFGWFEVPALVSGVEQQEELAGAIHYYGAWALVLIATVHALAALKHHFVDRDRTLVRMLRPGR
ncbi:Cytochrome b561 [wastewater metagenome]|uniref:Cytochrome b561 n=2 Tax=unclassified sequences TaxID=12908 RepID=A0A5B8RAN0_9ZZZZ|nr:MULTISPECIES: cytochrome b [Arhodomonas]MCS4505216.1 cytochrome b [Arhodomonas aquaeolei]QEA04998.1 cytochrome b561 [uncultured organism]